MTVLNVGSGPHVTVNGGSFTAFAVGFFGHGMDSGGVDPAVIEVEQGADGYGE